MGNVTERKLEKNNLVVHIFEYNFVKIQFVADPIKWLNKFEKLISDNEVLFSGSSSQGRMMNCYTIIERKRKEIEQTGYKHTAAKLPMQYVNAECEVRFFSFKETQKRVDELQDYTHKIMLLT